MKHRMGIGPGAASLILMILIVALGVLAMLTTIEAQNDNSLTVRSLEMTQVYYDLVAQSEHSLSRLDAVLAEAEAQMAEDKQDYISEHLPESMTLQGQTVRWLEEKDDKALLCEVSLEPVQAGKRYSVKTRCFGTKVGMEERLSESEATEEEDFFEEEVNPISVAAEAAYARYDELAAMLKQAALDAKDQAEYLTLVQTRLPEKMTLDGEKISWQETIDENRSLRCEVTLSAWPEGSAFWTGSEIISAQ